MELDLDDLIKIGSARGKKASPLAMRVVRELNEGDRAELENPSPKGVEIQQIAKLRHTHHMLARLLAQGTPPGEASLITGYSPSRISVLQRDPAFAELLTYYKTQTEQVYLNVHERMASLGMATVDELQERLESDPEAFSNRELMELAELLLDRTVAPPKGAKGQAGGGGGAAPVTVKIEFKQSQAPQLESGTGTGTYIDLEVGEPVEAPPAGGGLLK